MLDTRRLIDTALAERPRIAITDQLTGTLLALTDSTELRSGRRLADADSVRHPARTPTARPIPSTATSTCATDAAASPAVASAPAAATSTTRSRTPAVPTAHDNLACLCEHHHRLSHQAPGWRLHRDADGSLVWTLPSGRTVTTRPPAFGTDDGSTTTAAAHRPGAVRRRARRDPEQPTGLAATPWHAVLTGARHALGRSTDLYGLG